MYKPSPESKTFLLLLFGKKNYGIYLKRLITVYLFNSWIFTRYLLGIYLGKYVTDIYIGFLHYPYAWSVLSLTKNS